MGQKLVTGAEKKSVVRALVSLLGTDDALDNESFVRGSGAA